MQIRMNYLKKKMKSHTNHHHILCLRYQQRCGLKCTDITRNFRTTRLTRKWMRNVVQADATVAQNECLRIRVEKSDERSEVQPFKMTIYARDCAPAIQPK